LQHHFGDLVGNAAGETMLILIVEDEPIVAWSLADSLRESGHTILGPAASSDEAIQLCAPCMPGLALVDITLDGRVEGIALARRLKSEMSIDSIFMTAQPMLARENADAALGLIEKPYLPELVSRAIAVIDEMLNGRAGNCSASALEWFGRSGAPTLTTV
jgi:two-component system, response regulator PdtaR